MELYTLFDTWAQAGVFDVLLPWMLFFALVFALTKKIGPLSEPRVATLIALAGATLASYGALKMGLTAMIPVMSGLSGVALIGFLFVISALKMFDIDIATSFGDRKWLLAALIILVPLALYFGKPNVNLSLDSTMVTNIVALAVFAGMILVVVTGGEPTTKAPEAPKGK